MLLGERDGRTWFAVIADAALAAPSATRAAQWYPLRGLLPYLAGDAVAQAPLVFHALGLAEWHWVTRFCPRCGGSLEPRAAGHELRCTSCGKRAVPAHRPGGDHGR